MWSKNLSGNGLSLIDYSAKYLFNPKSRAKWRVGHLHCTVAVVYVAMRVRKSCKMRCVVYIISVHKCGKIFIFGNYFLHILRLPVYWINVRSYRA